MLLAGASAQKAAILVEAGYMRPITVTLADAQSDGSLAVAAPKGTRHLWRCCHLQAPTAGNEGKHPGRLGNARQIFGEESA